LTKAKSIPKLKANYKLLIPKVDYLLKCVGKRKTLSTMPRVKTRKFYVNKKCAHAKNEVMFAQILHDSNL
jgi:hypothetical protein